MEIFPHYTRDSSDRELFIPFNAKTALGPVKKKLVFLSLSSCLCFGLCCLLLFFFFFSYFFFLTCWQKKLFFFFFSLSLHFFSWCKTSTCTVRTVNHLSWSIGSTERIKSFLLLIFAVFFSDKYLCFHCYGKSQIVKSECVCISEGWRETIFFFWRANLYLFVLFSKKKWESGQEGGGKDTISKGAEKSFEKNCGEKLLSQRSSPTPPPGSLQKKKK